MSLPKKIATTAASIAGLALFVAASASAQTLDRAAAAAASPKADANFAPSTSGALPQPSAAATVRPTSKAQAPGTESGTGQAARVANELK